MSSSESPKEIGEEALRQQTPRCAVLVVAAGFEDRAARVTELIGPAMPLRVIVVKYAAGIAENDRMFAKIVRIVETVAPRTETKIVVLDPIHPDDYLNAMKAQFRNWRPDSVGEVWIDISALPMQGICATLSAAREAVPELGVRVLYTEPKLYFPTKKEVSEAESNIARKRAGIRVARQGRTARERSGRRSEHHNSGVKSELATGERADTVRDFSDEELSFRLPKPALSREMSGNLIPKQFRGSSSEVSTCLILFAGYEQHRSLGVVDQLNPGKLVLAFGMPYRPELQWRLQWSQRLHEPLRGGRPTASETVSTLDPMSALCMLNEYYGYLFSDHNIAVSPICSKMQCVACYLFWERYRDVQLVFPLPVQYVPSRFSEKSRTTFEYVLPTPAEMSILAPSLLSGRSASRSTGPWSGSPDVAPTDASNTP